MYVGNKKYRTLRTYLYLNDYQGKSSRYSYRSTYMSFMVITKQKPTINKYTQKNKHTKTIQNRTQTEH